MSNVMTVLALVSLSLTLKHVDTDIDNVGIKFKIPKQMVVNRHIINLHMNQTDRSIS